MKYNEETANKIALEHNINATTLKVWKNRGKIPDRYLRANFSRVEPLNDDQRKIQNKILKILYLPEIRIEPFSKLNAITRATKISDVKLKKASFTQSEMDAVIGKISEIKAELSAILRDDRRFMDKYEQKLFDFLKRPEIVVIELLCKTGSLTISEYNQVKNKSEKRIHYELSVRLLDKVTDAFKKLYVQIQ